MQPHLSPSLEVLESRTLLAHADSGLSDIEKLLAMSWEEAAITGAGMFVYGAFFFVAAEGGECSVTPTSSSFTTVGLLMGYHVGNGIAHNWLGLAPASARSEAQVV